MALKPWHLVATPREDLREERPLDASEFAVHLDQVRDGTAPLVYRDPGQFFDRTYLTRNLAGLATEVVRRLSGHQVETSAVFNLSTQFGGGKTHALTLLYHLARHGSAAGAWKGVPALLSAAKIENVPRADVAVFVGTEFDSIVGRGGNDGSPQRKTPWGEIAFQLGGAELLRVFAEHEKTLTAPGGDVIAKLFSGGRPTLILLDELMNYVSRSRKSGLGGQLHSFLHNLSEVARSKTNVVLAVSIPASELEMSADDQADFDRFKKILDRLGKAVILSAEADSGEIIRRRLFEWEGLPAEAKGTLREYSEWLRDHKNDIPTWFPVETAYESLAASYPFHPVTLSVFERKWRALPRFQQTRGVLRMMALWVSKAFQDGFRGGAKDALIGLGSAPLHDSQFRAAIFEQLGEQRLEGAVTTDVAGRPESHAVRLDKEAVDAVRKSQLHRKVATSIFFESNGGMLKTDATLPEVRLAVGEPNLDLSSVEQCIEALGETCYFLHVDKGRFHFEFKANLNKLLADRRASVDKKKIDELVRAVVREEFGKGSDLERVFFPEKTSDIPDRASLALAVLGPDKVLAELGTKTLVESMIRECGSGARVFRSAVLACVADDGSALREEARKALAWEDILSDREDLKLEDAQVKQVKESAAKAKSYLREAVWQTYRNVFLLDEGNEVRRLDLGKVHSSSAPSLLGLITGRLRKDDLLTDAVSGNTLVKNWPPALPEWTTRALRDAFYSSPRFPRLTNAEVLKSTIARAVSDGLLAYAGRRGERFEPFTFKKAIAASDIDFSEDFVVLRREDAERIKAAVEGSQQVGPVAPSGPTPPVPPQPPGPGLGVSEGGAQYGPGASALEKAKGLRWEGELPWQKWTTFYSKVCSRFSTKGLRLRVIVEVEPPDGVSDQERADTANALRELGLTGDLKLKS